MYGLTPFDGYIEEERFSIILNFHVYREHVWQERASQLSTDECDVVDGSGQTTLIIRT